VLSSPKDKLMMHRRCTEDAQCKVLDTEAYQCGKFLLSVLDSIRLVREVLTNYMAIEG
jgi:hypothetical protein